MFESFFIPRNVCERLQEEPLGQHFEALAVRLVQDGYSPRQIGRELRGALAFGHWLMERRLTPADAGDVARMYLDQLGVGSNGRRPQAALGVAHLVSVLRQPDAPLNVRPAWPGETDAWISKFDQHLERVVGLALRTRVNYVRIVRRFIKRCYGNASPEWLTLQPEHIRDFLTEQMSLLAKSPSRSAPVTAIRAFLKLLVTSGLIHASLLAALPVVRVWRLASIPRHLSPDEVAWVLSSVDERSPTGIRDRAILLTLARLGMRAGEVACLDLDDIDWRDGRILVRSGKTHRERCLPLSPELGTAFVRYLQEARPKTSYRAVFLAINAPRRRITSHAITAMATRYLTRAGVNPSRLGAHCLRHSVATQLVRGGASFKEVADILGHQQLRSTQVYAKLDLSSLARIAMPWPKGGVR